MKKFTISLLFLLSLSSVFALSVKKCDAIEQEVGHIYFTVGYDEDTECPLYVIYTLDEEEAANLGTVKRKDAFRADKEIITKSASPSDYTNSGFDRGHMFPSYHGTFCFEADNMSFVMSNMCPQYKAMNRGAWKKHEFYIIDIAKRYGDVERACGPIFDENKPARWIGQKNRIRVPDAFYSIISYNKNGRKTIECIIMSNAATTNAITIEEVGIEDIEKLTGIDFEE